MIYTFGRTSSYDEHIRTTEDPRKLGRSEHYHGGAVWRTRAAAQAYINGLPDEHCPDWYAKDFSVYGVEADWEVDTYRHAGTDPWRSLKRDGRLVALS